MRDVLPPPKITEITMGAHKGTLSYYTAQDMFDFRNKDVEQAASLVKRAARQIERWSEKYGEHQPEWLPPAGDVRLLEDIEDFLQQLA